MDERLPRSRLDRVHRVNRRLFNANVVLALLVELAALAALAYWGLVLVWLLTAALFRISSLASITAAIAAPPMALYFLGNWPEAWVMFPIAALLIWRHRANIRKLLAGEERKIGR